MFDELVLLLSKSPKDTEKHLVEDIRAILEGHERSLTQTSAYLRQAEKTAL